MLQDLMQTLNDPHARHAMMVHLPIAGAFLAMFISLIWALTRFRSTGLGASAAVLFLTASLGAALAANAGEAAAESVEGSPMTPTEKAALEQHEELGENGWIWPLIPAALIGLAAFSRSPAPGKITRIRVVTGLLALAGSVGVSVWVANTAHTGGALVYTHGLGVPARGAAPARPSGDSATPARHDEDDD
ncbi:MAG: hypothetical protein IT436_16990 [Phycisphaerales bacterium]|nr:hypothetical protein [Phycisphaerales bacterium]